MGRQAAALVLWLIVSLAAPAAAVAGPSGQATAVTLQEALRTGQVEAWAEPLAMGFRQPMLLLHVASRSGASLHVTIPRGTHLNAPDASFADLVVSDPVECTAVAETAVEVNAFSLAADRSFPAATGSYRYMVANAIDEKLLRLLDIIAKRSAPDRFAAQLAVWSANSGRALEQIGATLPTAPEPGELEEAQHLLDLTEVPAISGSAIALIVGGVLAAAALLAVLLAWRDHRKKETLVEPLSPVVSRPGRPSRPPEPPKPPRRPPTPQPRPVTDPELKANATPARSQPRPRLVGVSGPLTGREFDLAECCLISRSPIEWVIIAEASVSAPHAALDLSQPSGCIKDLNSTNGVTVGAERLGKRWVDLAPGQEFSLGPAVTMACSAGSVRVTGGRLAGRSFRVGTGLIVISRTMMPVLETGDDDRRISDAHALLRLEEGVLSVKDLNSSNGTTIDTQPVEGEASLQPGQRLGLGGSEFEFQEGE